MSQKKLANGPLINLTAPNNRSFTFPQAKRLYRKMHCSHS